MTTRPLRPPETIAAGSKVPDGGAPDRVRLEVQPSSEENMRIPCPYCPDGNLWTRDGPTGTCPVCGGKAFLYSRVSNPDSFALDEDSVFITEDDDCPYCECGNDPTEEEAAFNQCDACGKPFE